MQLMSIAHYFLTINTSVFLDVSNQKRGPIRLTTSTNESATNVEKGNDSPRPKKIIGLQDIESFFLLEFVARSIPSIGTGIAKFRPKRPCQSESRLCESQ